MKKLVFLASFLLVGLIILGVFGQKSVSTELEIAVPPEVVWQALMETSSYSDWNPIFVEVEGDFQTGNEILVHMAMGGEVSEVSVKVRNVVANQWLNQKGGYPGFLTYDHSWHLDPAEGGTKLRQHEVYTGLYVWFWDPSEVQDLYAEGNRKLKARLEGKQDG